MKKKKITKKRIIIAVIVVIIGILIFTNVNKNNTEDVAKAEVQNIEKRTIAKSISTTGVINSTNTKNVVATLTGSEILSVNVKKGDKVNVGDVICTFDTSTIQENLRIAEATQSNSQEQANIGVVSAQRSLNDAISNRNTQLNSSQDEINNTKNAYDSAINQLNTLNSTLAQKQQALENAQKNNASSSANYEIAKADLDTKENARNQAKSNYEAKKAELEYIKGLEITDPTNPILQTIGAVETEANTLKTLMDKAESEYLSSKSNYDTINASYAPTKASLDALVSEVTGLQTQKASLEANANTLKATYDKLISAHNATVATTDSTIASMRDAVRNSELAASSSSLASAAQINAYKEQIENGTVKATVSGTVTSVNVKKGDLYTGSTIATIEGTEEFIVEAEIDEYDIPDVEVGMKVLIKTDATRDEELEGRITYVASSATNGQSASMAGMSGTSGVSAGASATYKIEIALDSQNDRLRLGMNAKLSIITQMQENVWSVPYNAIYEREDGTHYIEIAKDEEGEEKEELNVTTGIEGTYYTEIKSDSLKDGMRVILPKVDAADSMEALIEMMGANAGM